MSAARASHRQLENFSKTVLELYRTASLETLGEDFVRAARRLLDADRISTNWFEGEEHTARVYSDPAPAAGVSYEPWKQHILQHPLINLRLKARTAPGLLTERWSDFQTLREFRKKALYQEYFRLAETNYQLAIVGPRNSALDFALSCNRKTRDFSDEDKFLLKLLGPHFQEIFRQAKLRAEISRTLALQDAGLSGTPTMLVAGDGALVFCTKEARRLCEYYFPRSKAGETPREILHWLGTDGCENRRFFTQRGEDRLTIECAGRVFLRDSLNIEMNQPAPRVFVIRMAERSVSLSTEALRGLGLTVREAEVLFWVAEGKTNQEIAIILDSTANTVRKHMEHIHQKLGVENRASAAVLARDMLKA